MTTNRAATSCARSAGAVSEDELSTDIRYLKRLWKVVQGRMQTAAARTLLHEDLALALRSMRDLVRRERREGAHRFAARPS